MVRKVVFAALLAGGSSLASAQLFQDEFNGSINGAWSITRPDANYYTVGASELALRGSSGVLTGNANNAKNVFLISNPTVGDFQVILKLNSFVPAATNYSQIDLLAYDDDDNMVRANYVHINGRAMEIGKEVGGSWSQQHTFTDMGSGAFYMRLTKAGATYTQSYSFDGIAYTDVNASITYGDGTPTFLGFVVSDDPSESSVAHIDSFTVVPEPGTIAAVALGLGAIAARRRRR